MIDTSHLRQRYQGYLEDIVECHCIKMSLKGRKHTVCDFINSACVKETDDVVEIVGYDAQGNKDEWF